MEVIYTVFTALPGVCQEAGHVGGAVPTPVCPGTKNKTGGGEWISCILSKTSITMSSGPNFPQVHGFDNANFLGTQCRTVTNYLNSACNSLKR